MEQNASKEVVEVIEDFDLAQADVVKDANKGGEVSLYHPTNGKDVGITIYIVGKDSDTFKAIQAEQNRKRMAKIQKGGFRAANTAVANVDQEAVELLAACTTGWSRMPLNGKDVPFSTENAETIYAKFPWIKEQVDVAIADRALFTKG